MEQTATSPAVFRKKDKSRQPQGRVTKGSKKLVEKEQIKISKPKRTKREKLKAIKWEKLNWEEEIPAEAPSEPELLTSFYLPGVLLADIVTGNYPGAKKINDRLTNCQLVTSHLSSRNKDQHTFVGVKETQPAASNKADAWVSLERNQKLNPIVMGLSYAAAAAGLGNQGSSLRTTVTPRLKKREPLLLSSTVKEPKFQVFKIKKNKGSKQRKHEERVIEKLKTKEKIIKKVSQQKFVTVIPSADNKSVTKSITKFKTSRLTTKSTTKASLKATTAATDKPASIVQSPKKPKEQKFPQFKSGINNLDFHRERMEFLLADAEDSFAKTNDSSPLFKPVFNDFPIEQFNDSHFLKLERIAMQHLARTILNNKPDNI